MIQRSTRTLVPMILLLAGYWPVLPAHAELSITRGSQAGNAVTESNRVPEWIYTVRPGESFDEIASALLARNVATSRLLQHNGIDNPATVSSGDSLRIPLAWLQRQPDPARARSVVGQVQLVSGNNGDKRPLTEEMLVRVGDEILSHSGTATVELADGSVVRISPNSRLAFNRLTQYGRSGMVDTRLRLDRGEIETRVKPVIEGGSRFEIETPSAVAAVRGTMFTLRTAPGKTDLRVTEGEVSFGPPGKTRRIPAGYSASVSTVGVGNMSIRRLPPAPTINPLPPELKQLPTSLSWQPSGAAAHRVDIFDAESGRWMDSSLVNGDSFKIDLLDNGRYDIHLAALDSRGIAGMPGIISVDVDLRARTATLEQPEPGAIVNDDMPEFRWQLLGENEVARVEIAEDQEFGNLVATSEWAPDQSALPSRPLSPGQYYWRVVTEAGGNSVATSETRALVVNGTLPPVRIISVNYIDSQVRVFWQKVDTAVEYRLQLSEEPRFDNIIKEATLSDTTAALRLIPGRRYFVRLKALSDGPLESRWGPGRELFLE
ncbi:FecR family protein [Marinobacter orientalis]|uniref:LysM peptidoglycan-binding domain-containing protein n=1 Tax=Marinobacter orientalis TaxID=1928859 RepID=A0A7Y0RC64_9GAMM|nr:FecR domain-containing protein [Marinobacter orientalis]NMT63528.1 LysM peptidoglycan-binding domain-containing protein [Marinobacter orientalis]TGX48584.1 LysM peptidoglycan-binding domain-containing protein [Marinobacter orientalis]